MPAFPPPPTYRPTVTACSVLLFAATTAAICHNSYHKFFNSSGCNVYNIVSASATTSTVAAPAALLLSAQCFMLSCFSYTIAAASWYEKPPASCTMFNIYMMSTTIVQRTLYSISLLLYGSGRQFICMHQQWRVTSCTGTYLRQ